MVLCLLRNKSVSLHLDQHHKLLCFQLKWRGNGARTGLNSQCTCSFKTYSFVGDIPPIYTYTYQLCLSSEGLPLWFFLPKDPHVLYMSGRYKREGIKLFKTGRSQALVKQEGRDDMQWEELSDSNGHGTTIDQTLYHLVRGTIALRLVLPLHANKIYSKCLHR